MFWHDRMYPRFALYGFLKNLRFFDPFIILIFREAGLSYLQIGTLYAIRDIATNLLEIPTGVLADAWGRRRAMLAAFASYIISFLLFYFAKSFWSFALAMLLFAGGEAFRTGTHKALILEYLKITNMLDQKVAYYGRTRAASQFGSAINALIAAGLVFWSGQYRTMFLVATLPYVLDFFNLLTYPPELDGRSSVENRPDMGTQLRATLHDFVSVFRSPLALRALLNSAGFDGFFKATKDYLQPILQTLALSLPVLLAWDNQRRSAIVIGLVYFALYLLTSYASRSADDFQKRFPSLESAVNRTFVLGAFLLMLAGLASQVNQPVLAVLAFIGIYLLHNVRRPLNIANISDQIASKVMASGLSTESQATTLLVALLSVLLGGIADRWGVGMALIALGILQGLLYPLIKVTTPGQKGNA